MLRRLFFRILSTGLALSAVSVCCADERVRIATYNIEFLNASIPASRADQLKDVIASLDADIIGLEEIADRAALERVFDPSEWSLVIDDQSNDNQDVAAAVRKPFRVISPTSLDAGDDDFLFPDSANNSNWPNRRDGLLVEIETPDQHAHIRLIVVHSKARAGGRTNTDPRRVGAARDLVSFLEDKVDDGLYVIVGDYNDNPDDRSANILETGDPNALPGPEQIEGPFMFNLTESLLVDDRVSWGLSAANIVNGALETQVVGSRQVNNASRESSSDTISPILFDQIVVSPLLQARYASASVQVFNDPIAFQAGKASDHVPVFADFIFDSSDDEAVTPAPLAPVTGPAPQIIALLPDPEAIDAGNEWVKLSNAGNQVVDLTGWRLRDRAGNVKELKGAIPAGGQLEVQLAQGELPLNNSGDDIELVDAAGNVAHRFSFTAAHVQPGQEVTAADLLGSISEEQILVSQPELVIARVPSSDRAARVLDQPQPGAIDTAVVNEVVFQGIPINEFQEFPVKVLAKEHFVVGYAEDFLNPAWVFYRIGPAVDFRKFRRPGFRIDNDTVSRVKTQDYSDSGFSRGHMAPNFALGSRFGAEGAKSTFVMSNVVPQFQSFNDGQWGDLEEWIAGRKPPHPTAENFIRGWADEFDEVWVVVGPLFEDERDTLNSGIPVPSGFFCIVVDEQEDGQPRVLAFIMPHEDQRVDELKGFLKTVDEIESRSGLDFFHLLEDSIENSLEGTRATELWPLPVPPN